jgi:putative two-component system response regulator
VLVVDDDHATLATIEAILGGAGYRTTCHDRIDRARRALIDTRFDLVLTDLYIGDDALGYEIAELARLQRPPVPVILLTARPSFGGACEALRSEVREIVVKPIEAAVLVTACRKAIDAAEVERRSRRLDAQNRVLSAVVPRMVEAKDPTTSGHSDRVVHYADRLALRCGVTDEDRESLRLASLMHDVGKVGIPRSILCKEGPLTADERTQIQRHPSIGYDILAPLEDCDNARLWVLQHHERWDGRGYPNALHRDDVALPGRILILAEVYDALAEARSYKEAWDVRQIVGFFREQAGRHFDPDLAHLVADGLEREGKRFFAPGPGLLF